MLLVRTRFVRRGNEMRFKWTLTKVQTCQSHGSWKAASVANDANNGAEATWVFFFFSWQRIGSENRNGYPVPGWCMRGRLITIISACWERKLQKLSRNEQRWKTFQDLYFNAGRCVCVCKCAPSGGRLTNGINKHSSPLISRQRLHGGGGGGGGSSHCCRRFCGFRFGLFFIYCFLYFGPLAADRAVLFTPQTADGAPGCVFAALNLH